MFENVKEDRAEVSLLRDDLKPKKRIEEQKNTEEEEQMENNKDDEEEEKREEEENDEEKEEEEKEEGNKKKKDEEEEDAEEEEKEEGNKKKKDEEEDAEEEEKDKGNQQEQDEKKKEEDDWSEKRTIRSRRISNLTKRINWFKISLHNVMCKCNVFSQHNNFLVAAEPMIFTINLETFSTEYIGSISSSKQMNLVCNLRPVNFQFL